MDDAPLLSFITREQQKNTKKMRPLVYLVSFEIFAMIALLIVAFASPIPTEKDEKYFVLIYAHMGFWGFVLILERFLKYYHRKLRLYGYFGVHKKTKKFNKTAGYVFSAGNLLLLSMTTVYENYCATIVCKDTIFGGDFKRGPYILIVFILEFLVAQPLLIWYLAIIFQLMRSNVLPDILYEDRVIGSSQTSDLLREVGSRMEGDTTEDLLERQANYIQFLQERNAVLALKIAESRQ